ncbi:unnamed protein product [Notodromas monacha]|uniref:Protein kinase domain-containing protein n=1 Tax=Notodromas monacha TaxID=399045 RepID=A0A7R9BUI0_9CRUS|nr:unnamed protein product [Notodromas monacha]CAG0921627.1 unnamed protein product [Notodromas monacha]
MWEIINEDILGYTLLNFEAGVSYPRITLPPPPPDTPPPPAPTYATPVYASLNQQQHLQAASTLSSQFSAHQATVTEMIKELCMDRARLRFSAVVQEGTYGRVYRGVYTSPTAGKGQEVLIKTVTSESSSVQRTLLLGEGLLMFGLSHPNILPIIGVSVEEQPSLVYPYVNAGNLKLKRTREEEKMMDCNRALSACKSVFHSPVETAVDELPLDADLKLQFPAFCSSGFKRKNMEHLWCIETAVDELPLDADLKLQFPAFCSSGFKRIARVSATQLSCCLGNNLPAQTRMRTLLMTKETQQSFSTAAKKNNLGFWARNFVTGFLLRCAVGDLAHRQKKRAGYWESDLWPESPQAVDFWLEWGFLKSCQVGPEGATVSYPLLTQEVVRMAIQVAQACAYLTDNDIVHRDLATRSCMVDDKMKVKLADNALSRDLFPDDYQCLGDMDNRPLRWMPPEAIVDKRFSEASDVWAFGVLLWELTTLAQQPYEEVDPFEMVNFLYDGYRLYQPIHCPDELFHVMATCWDTDPGNRPSFRHIISCLRDFRESLDKYI